MKSWGRFIGGIPLAGVPVVIDVILDAGLDLQTVGGVVGVGVNVAHVLDHVAAASGPAIAVQNGINLWQKNGKNEMVKNGKNGKNGKNDING